MTNIKMTSHWHYVKFWHRFFGIKTIRHEVEGYSDMLWQTGLFGRGGKWIIR